MARLLLHPEELVVELTMREKALGLRKQDLVIPRAAIRSAVISDDPWVWVRGVPHPGTHVLPVFATGTWKFHGGSDFLLIRGRKRSVVIGIDPQLAEAGGSPDAFQRIIITTSHAADLVAALRIANTDSIDVVEL